MAAATNVGSRKLAHDLRSQILIIAGYTELIGKETMAPKSAAYCQKILTSCSRLRQMVDGELSGQSLAPVSPIPLEEMLRECVSMYEAAAGRKEIRIELELNKALPVAVDVVEFRRILDNLISNAVKFSPRGSRVFVSACASGDMVVIEVRDQGPGISEEEAVAVFEIDRCGRARPTEGERSSGLGLAIVRQLVKELGGEVKATSRPEGGAVFRITLPRLQAWMGGTGLAGLADGEQSDNLGGRQW
jgi:signal transduction histidine kinase